MATENTDKRSKFDFLQVRLTKREYDMLGELVSIYRLRDRAQFLRIMFDWLILHKPALTVHPDMEAPTTNDRYWMQLKTDDREQRAAIKELAVTYGLSEADFCRVALRHFHYYRPALVMQPIQVAKP